VCALQTEKGTSAFMTVDVTTELGDGDHVRVAQAGKWRAGGSH